MVDNFIVWSRNTWKQFRCLFRVTVLDHLTHLINNQGRLCVAMIFSAVIIFDGSRDACAATFNVADGDVSGLIQAINAAKSNPGPDTVNLAQGGTYTLTYIAGPDSFHGPTGLPIVQGFSETQRESLTINGNGSTIQRSDAPGIPEFRIFHALYANVILDNVVIKGGRGYGSRCGGGGLYLNVSNTVIRNSTITENFGVEGGGICNNNASTLTIENSTISHNTGPGGEILNHAASLSISSTTVYDDQANSYRSDSIVDAFSSPGSIVIKNSIVANRTGGIGINCFGFTPVSLGHNIFGDSTCGQNVSGGDLIVPNLSLGPLASNGASTPTHALLAGSPAINAIPNLECTNIAGLPITTDQRGVVRPRSAACDIGSFEFNSTPPTITATLTGPLGTNGWYTGDVEVTWSINDAESNVSSSTGCDTTVVTADTAGVTFTCTAINDGGSTTESVTIKRDANAPAIACASADGLWHATDTSIACTADDGMSQLDNASNSNFSLTTSVFPGTETSNAVTDSHTVCDNAGNCTTAGPISGNKVDKKAPTKAITAPVAGTYILNQSVTVNFDCTDGGSGVASCIATSANGSALDTASIGSKTFTVAATDNVGNSAAASEINYTVGFGLQVVFDQSRAHKAGSTVPIKVRLVDANGNNVSSGGLVVHAASVIQISSNASTLLDDAGNANPDFDFRYDAALGGYIFNLKSTGYTTGSYLLYFGVAGDPTLHSVQFQIRQ